MSTSVDTNTNTNTKSTYRSLRAPRLSERTVQMNLHKGQTWGFSLFITYTNNLRWQ
jgi:hypothetical protein